MSKYHPTDVRYKHKEPVAAVKKSPLWQNVSLEAKRPWQRPGPVRDSERTERKNRESVARAAEKPAIESVGVLKYIWGTMANYAQLKGAYTAEKAVGNSTVKIIAKVVSALASYFLILKADQLFGINDLIQAFRNGFINIARF